MNKTTVSLNTRGAFNRVYACKSSYSHSLVVSYIKKSKYKTLLRVGITTSKKIGKAVKRNRARRIIKAALIALEPNLKKGYDIVFVARHKTTLSSMNDVLPVIKNHLKKAGVLND